MNKTFKVVYNRARAGLMVANEITSSVQKRGTKTVVAVGVAMLMVSGAVLAQDIEYSQTSENKGYKLISEGSQEFSADDVLKMTITGKNTKAYGLLATGKDARYTNKGTIKVNLSEETNRDNTANPWSVKGMMADAGGTVINDGTIEVIKAYGMTVGSSKGEGTANTIINNGTVNVTNGFGVGMEAAPTGSAGTNPTAKAVAINYGTINVEPDDAIGILVSGNNGEITNYGTINANGYAVVIQKEECKTASENIVTFATGSVTKGDVIVKANDKNQAAQNTQLIFKKGATFDGYIDVSIKASGTKLTADGQTFSNQRRTGSSSAGGSIFFGDATSTSSIQFTDTNFVNNTITGIGGYVGGGAVLSYAASFSQTGGTYSGNKAISDDDAFGGALMLKGTNPIVFTDVVFTNNSAESTGASDKVALGGAVLVDYSTGAATGVERATDVKFAITKGKDITYSGNTVTSSAKLTDQYDTGGYHVKDSAVAGGFLFLDRGSAAEFGIEEGAKLTIGLTGTEGDTDGIASSIPNAGTTTNSGKHAAISKTGAGTLIVNSSLNKYFGTVDVTAGTMVVNSDWEIKNSVTVHGGTLSLGVFSFGAVEEGVTDSPTVKVTVQKGGTLVIDQAKVGDNLKEAPESSLKVEQGGKLSIANASIGEIDFGQTLELNGTVVTDNPFVSGAFKDGTITLVGTASEEGMSALASMGIQSMIRRADMVLAETIADRMASDVQTGSNLWVNVRGEHYERDRLDNGAGFKANIGYGAFGAEFAPTDTTTLGAAFQYGNGTVKGDVASVKNKTKDYSFALYGSAMLGDTGVKAVGEVAYTKSTNDITSSLALLNQDTDATVLSVGVKAQKTFDVGTFEVTPSLGVRVSHIKTDAMKAGTVELEKQKQTIVQIPIALRVNAKATETAGGWSVTPKFKVAYIPTVGDKSIEVFGVKQSVIDTSPVQGTFGVDFAKGNLAIDAAAHLGAGNKGTSAVGGKVGLTYRF